MATGKFAPDGVLQADIISPQQDQSAAGSMYGEIVRVEGRRIQVRPRYTQDTITVVRKADCILQKEVRLDPDGFKVGDPVTFWGHYVRRPGSERPLLGALALLVGNGRYPTSSDPESAGVFLSGRLSSLEPVVLLSPSGQKTEIIVPAQIAIARLDRVSEAELTVGTPVMMVLSSGKDDTFEASHIIVDASPWVGYGG
ncbi:MAG: hypothetical protein SFU56_02055 [Capsulimonadales bacterium]|nr:hypothetical protein [Capsulimonadales bacterium]